MSFKAKALAGLFAAAVLGIGGDYVYNNAYNYSSGDRTGQIFKLSHKGTLCKTWEGQMTTDGVGRVDGQSNRQGIDFEFTVMDKDLLPKIQEAERTGERVDLHYRQVKWKLSCLQESEYVATDITKVDGTGRSVPFVITTQPGPRK